MARPQRQTGERCELCGCRLTRGGRYAADDTPESRANATEHHYVAERLFGRTANRPGVCRARTFETCPWGLDGRSAVFCYECHELLLHNPVLTPEDVQGLAQLAKKRGLAEIRKPIGRTRLAGRAMLLNEVIREGIRALLER